MIHRPGRRAMESAGLKAYARQEERKTGVYWFERPPALFPLTLERTLRADKAAWTFWLAQRTVPGAE